MAIAPPNPWLIAADLFDPPPDTHVTDREECRASSAVFARRHLKIEDKTGRIISFDLWPCQVDTFGTLEEEPRVIILKGRQLGMSWLVLAFALWLAIFQQGIRILILCKKEEDSKKLLGRIKRMHRRMGRDPDSQHILSGLLVTKNDEKTFGLGDSTIMALVGNEDSARSESAGLLILDEFAFQAEAPGIWQAGGPATEGGGRMIALSTGNGSEKSKRKGAEFAKQWRRAKLGLSGFKAIFHNWRAHPDRDDAWYEVEEAAMGDPMKMRIEHPTTEDDAFLIADADLIYPGSHIDAAIRLGRLANKTDSRVIDTLYLGIDWGVHTHMTMASQTAGGGIRALSEYYSERADIEIDVTRCAAIIAELQPTHCMLRYDPGAAGAKVIGTFLRMLRAACPRVTFEVKAIPFSKFKVVGIQYLQMLARRAEAGEMLRVLAADEVDVPELLRQMREAEWKDADVGRTEKGDDHGHDSLLTLTAELGYAMFSAERKG